MRRPPRDQEQPGRRLPHLGDCRPRRRARNVVSSWTISPPAARSRNSASPVRVSRCPTGFRRRGHVQSAPVSSSDAPTSSCWIRRADAKPSARPRSPASQSGHNQPSTSSRPSSSTVRRRRRRRRARSRPRSPPRSGPSTPDPLGELGPQPGRQQRLSVRARGSVRCCGHWFSHCARNDSLRVGLLRVVDLARSCRLQLLRDQPFPPRRPVRRRQPPRRRRRRARRPGAPTTRSADRRRPPRARPAPPAGGPASTTSPTGAPSRSAAAAAVARSTIVGVNPSSIARRPHLPRLIRRRTRHRVPVHRLLRPQHPPGTVREQLDLLLPVHLPHLVRRLAAPSPTTAPAAAPPYRPPDPSPCAARPAAPRTARPDGSATDTARGAATTCRAGGPSSAPSSPTPGAPSASTSSSRVATSRCHHRSGRPLRFSAHRMNSGPSDPVARGCGTVI